jgi:hypothetical protein
MKKSEPKMILNLSIENNELEEKIKIAMDKYTEDLIRKDLDEAVAKYVEERINRLLNGNKYTWDNERKIQGMYFSDFVRSKTEQAIADAIEKNAKDILAKKLASLL